MTTVRIHLNHDEGTLWWAEGGDFVGGSDKLDLLIEKIREWAKAECLEVDVQLMGNSVTSTTDTLDKNHPPPSSGNAGAEMIRVSELLIHA